MRVTRRQPRSARPNRTARGLGNTSSLLILPDPHVPGSGISIVEIWHDLPNLTGAEGACASITRPSQASNRKGDMATQAMTRPNQNQTIEETRAVARVFPQTAR